MPSVKTEAKRNASLSGDLDKFRQLYREVDGLSEVIYPSYRVLPFEINLFLLLSESARVDFQPKWQQRPDYASYDFYGSAIFWPILLYVNQVQSIEDFKDIDKLLVPSYNLILDLTREKLKIEEMETIKAPTLFQENAARLYKVYPLDKKDVDKLAAKTRLEDPFPPPSTGGNDSSGNGDDDIVDGGVINPDGSIT